MPKYRHTGVERNTVKRRLRELSRTEVIPALAAAPTDLVMRALPAAYDADFSRLRGDLQRVIGVILGAQGTRARGNEGSTRGGGEVTP